MNSKLEQFLAEVTSKIHSRRARKLAILELRSHILDKIDSLVASGASYEVALEEAIREMGSLQKIGNDFSIVYRPQLFLKLLVGISALMLIVTIAVTVYIDFKSQRKWNVRDAEADTFRDLVMSDINALAALPFSSSIDTDSKRNAGTYLDPLLRAKTAPKIIDLEKLLSFDYWDFTREYKDGKIQYPNVMFLFDYVKQDLVQGRRPPIHTLKLYRKIAELFHSNETMVSEYLAVAVLKLEQEFYEKSVKTGKIKKSDWKPVSPEILASAKRAVRGTNAYFGIFANNTNVPHAEKLCWAIGKATLNAIRVRPLLNEKFPLEADYHSNYAQIDHLLDVSRPYCRLSYLRLDWINPNMHEIDEFEIKPYISEPLWIAMQIGPYLPYFRRVIAKEFISEFTSDGLYHYDATISTISKSSS